MGIEIPPPQNSPLRFSTNTRSTKKKSKSKSKSGPTVKEELILSKISQNFSPKTLRLLEPVGY